MSEAYPIHIDLEGKKVVVIGGGVVATRKINGLCSTGASITVVSPKITPELRELVQGNMILWKEKMFSPNDIDDAFLIIAASNDKSTNEEVKESAKPTQLINVADNQERSNCIIPSVLRRGKLTISISTSGASPSLTKIIRQSLEKTYDERYESYIDFLAECRDFILQNVKDPIKKRHLLKVIVEDDRFLTSEKRKEEFQALLDGILNH